MLFTFTQMNQQAVNLTDQAVGPEEQAIYESRIELAFGFELLADGKVGCYFRRGCCADNCGRPLSPMKKSREFAPLGLNSFKVIPFLVWLLRPHPSIFLFEHPHSGKYRTWPSHSPSVLHSASNRMSSMAWRRGTERPT